MTGYSFVTRFFYSLRNDLNKQVCQDHRMSEDAKTFRRIPGHSCPIWFHKVERAIECFSSKKNESYARESRQRCSVIF